MELSAQPGGIEPNLPTCRETQCHGHGTCIPPPGGGPTQMCDCDLGYRGEFCEDTVNGALSVPLTTSIIVVLIGLLALAFILARLRQKQKIKQRRTLSEKDSYDIVI